MYALSLSNLTNNFFRTKVVTDQPFILNSITNVALAPLQFFIGQNSFEIKEKAIKRIQPSFSFPTVFKVLLCVAAFFFFSRRALLKCAAAFSVITLSGILTRIATCFQKELQDYIPIILMDSARKDLGNTPLPSAPSIESKKITIPNLKEKIEKHIEFFKTVKVKLDESKETAKTWLEDQRKSDYSYPFYTARYLEQNLTELSNEDAKILAQYPDYLSSYYECFGLMLLDFVEFLNEKGQI